MLRYYEQTGLIQSKRIPDYSYRVYDEETILKLKYIVVLRKLRIPVKHIREILEDEDTLRTISAFEQSISKLDEEIAALSTIRSIIRSLIKELNEMTNLHLRLDWINDSSALALVSGLPFSNNTVREDVTMENLTNATERLERLTDKDVRIVYLPPAAVASYQYEGDEPEARCWEIIRQFVLDHDLCRVKPDIRHYGFNAPNPTDESNAHGYEMWVTIPEEMEVTAPLTKKVFHGGLYAAHMIPLGAFEEWGWLYKWLEQSGEYEYRGDWDGSIQWGCKEELLNFMRHVNETDLSGDDVQLDLLWPIQERSSSPSEVSK